MPSSRRPPVEEPYTTRAAPLTAGLQQIRRESSYRRTRDTAAESMKKRWRPGREIDAEVEPPKEGKGGQLPERRMHMRSSAPGLSLPLSPVAMLQDPASSNLTAPWSPDPIASDLTAV
ncbi:hypothetical protein E2562_008538 [Oryza meyeriana var. granulata]|uniref:Uncharacterized protein n=1 Tax=Oryza meyeriana var. granulata TaxID=110450 RepID=A0A6G1C402_9ORYZ|nr:hypothetical protein E2562_008538 [Oryza meyeriana var. granulata]